MKSKNWLQRQNKDIYVKKSKKEGYLSRAAYKLIEIEKKYKIILKSNNILELGSSPGSWSQVICELNKNANIEAFDILDMKFNNSKINFKKQDFLEYNFGFKKKYDLILSDVAPNTTGHKATDHLRLISIIEEILFIVKNNLKENGSFIFKILKGSEYKDIIIKTNKMFKKVSIFKPNSSRFKSSEIYVVSQKFIF